MDHPSTKMRILFVAVEMFSDNGYENASMRTIAKAVGIKAASIYNHYASKREILRSAYAYYKQQQQLVAPSLEELLRLAETEPVRDLLMRMDFRYPPGVMETIRRILIIATHNCRDEDSKNFIRENVFDYLKATYIPLLNRLIELGRIAPIDAECFTNLLIYFALCSAALYRSDLSISEDQWHRTLDLVFTLLAPG